MRTVYTKEELEKAFDQKEKVICVKGALAQTIISKKRRQKTALWGGLSLAAMSLAAIPFTGGTSSAGVVTGLSIAGLTVGSVTISTAELAILCGTILGLTGIIAGAKVTFNNGNVIIEPTYRS